MNQDYLSTKKILNGIGKSTFVEFYYELKASDYEKIRKAGHKKNWTTNSINSKVNCGKAIFNKKYPRIALEIIISSKARNTTIELASNIFKNEFPNEVIPTIRFIRPEFVFEEEIIKKIFYGYDINSQYHFEKYIIDWYIPELKLAIEFDEKYHDGKIEIDAKRQTYIEEKLNCKFLRFKE